MKSFLNDRVTLHAGDCRDVLPTLPEHSVDSVVTDPPYHLTSGNAVYDFKHHDGKRRKSGGGFMGKQWDGGDIAFRPETWAEVLRVLKPGGHLLACGGTRTYHRLASAIEDAGFEVRDCILWHYGSGFPKSLDVSKALDRARNDKPDVERVREWLERRRAAAGITRKAVNEALGLASNGGGLMSSWTTNQTTACVPQWEQWLRLKELLTLPDDMDAEVWRLNGRKGTPGEAWSEREFYDEPTGGLHGGSGDTVGAFKKGRQAKPEGVTEAARQWQGFGTALKPATEIICLARKPLSEGTVAANVLKWGCGALNIDASRIPHVTVNGGNLAQNTHLRNSIRGGAGFTPGQGTGEATREEPPSALGRWPANIILSWPEDEYQLRRDVTPEQRCELYGWLSENA